MSKFTSLAIGLLTAFTLVPAGQAVAATGNQTNHLQPAGNLQAQLVIKIGPQIRREPVYYPSREDIRRRLAWEREQEARARWEAKRRRYRHSEGRWSRDDRHDRYYR